MTYSKVGTRLSATIRVIFVTIPDTASRIGTVSSAAGPMVIVSGVTKVTRYTPSAPKGLIAEAATEVPLKNAETSSFTVD